MAQQKSIRAHLVVGGFPPGAAAGHDMDYARMRLLEALSENPLVRATVANDYTDIARWLPTSRLLITYVAGPYPNDEQDLVIRQWLEEGGRWVALHGTSGGKAVPVGDASGQRKMVKMAHHATLGCFFLNHPPVRRFRVDVAGGDHPLTEGLPPSFEVADELYMLELQDPTHSRVMLTTQLERNPLPAFAFAYDQDTSLLPDGKTRVLAYTRDIGKGAVAYIALGHCHSPLTNIQPFVDKSVDPGGVTPLLFRGPWQSAEFSRLLRNALAWGAPQNA